MHREIQIKQFPIVTTHWWPKTRNERFVWENEQYLYCFLPLVHNHVQVIWVHTHIRCVCALDGGRVWSVVLTQLFKRQRRRQPIRSPHANTQSLSCNTREVCDWLLWLWRRVSTTLQTRPPSSVDADEPERAHTHTSHTGCVCALRSLGHGCVQEVKNDIYTVCFLTQTARFVS